MNPSAFSFQFNSFTSGKNSLVVLSLLLILCACNHKTQDQLAVPEGMSAISLKSYGKPFSIFVPDTSTHPLNISEESSGALLVKAGSTFAVSIFEEETDLALKRQDIASDEINKFKSYLVDEPNGILWESAITEPEFHFLVNTKVGESVFSFQDAQNTEWKPFGKTAVEAMFNSCKNLSPLQE